MKTLFSMFTLALATMIAQAQPTPQPPTPLPSNNNSASTTSGPAYPTFVGVVNPGPWAVQKVGQTRTYQFQVTQLPGSPADAAKTYTSFIGLPLEIHIYKDGAPVAFPNCSLAKGACTISDKFPGVYTAYVSYPGGFGITGTSLTVNVIPDSPEQRDMIVVTPSTVQGRDFEKIAAFANFSRRYEGQYSMTVWHKGIPVDTQITNGIAGSIKVFETEVLPGTTPGGDYIAVELRDRNNTVVASGGADLNAKSGYQQFTVGKNGYDGSIKLSFDHTFYTMNISTMRIVLVRDDQMFTLPAQLYTTGDGFELVYYQGSLNYRVELPLGHYSVGYIAQYNDGGMNYRMLPNALYVNGQTVLQ